MKFKTTTAQMLAKEMLTNHVACGCRWLPGSRVPTVYIILYTFSLSGSYLTAQTHDNNKRHYLFSKYDLQSNEIVGTNVSLTRTTRRYIYYADIIIYRRVGPRREYYNIQRLIISVHNFEFNMLTRSGVC